MTGRILIVDGIVTNRIALKVKLSMACHEVHDAESGAAALALLPRVKPDLVIVNIDLPDMAGVAFCRRLKTRPGARKLPLLMLTAEASRADKLDALRAGADDFLDRAMDEVMLLARVRSLLRARATSEELSLHEDTTASLGLEEGPAFFTPAARLALISEVPSTALGWRLALRGLAPARCDLLAPDQVLAHLRSAAPPPDLYLIEIAADAPMPGLRLLSELRSRAASRYAAILVVHAPQDRESAIMALDLGASDLVAGDAPPEEMAVRIRSQLWRKAEADRLRARMADGLKLSLTDPLTELYNRRYALPHLARIAARAAQSGRRFAVVLADIDRFKAVNDSHGHAAGDAVLQEVARRLRGGLRGQDLIARIGGEEFLAVLPDTDAPRAAAVAERLCRAMRRRPVDVGGLSLPVTLSLGVAIGGARTETAEDLLARADAALYRAKRAGRDQVTVSQTAA